MRSRVITTSACEMRRRSRGSQVSWRNGSRVETRPPRCSPRASSKAAVLYTELCLKEPGDFQTKVRLGDAWARCGEKAKAINAYQAAAEGFAKSGLLPRVIAASKLVLALDPSHSGVQQMLAGLYARRGGARKPNGERQEAAQATPQAEARKEPRFHELELEEAGQAAEPAPASIELELELVPLAMAVEGSLLHAVEHAALEGQVHRTERQAPEEEVLRSPRAPGRRGGRPPEGGAADPPVLRSSGGSIRGAPREVPPEIFRGRPASVRAGQRGERVLRGVRGEGEDHPRGRWSSAGARRAR